MRIFLDGFDRHVVEDIGEYAFQHRPIFEHIGNARWTPKIVFKDDKFAVGITEKIDACDVCVDAVRRDNAAHFWKIPATADNEVFRNHSIPKAMLRSVDITQELIQRERALFQALLHCFPS